MIRLEHVSKTFTTKSGYVHAVKDISLDINEGEIFGIIGFSGAGKSTLVRCMNLLERPEEGSVIVDDKNLLELDGAQLREMRKKIGMIFQHFNLMRSRTVAQNVAFPLKKSGLSKEEIRQKVMELLELVDLSEKANVYPSQLSGGQKQRVAIAGVIAMEPKCIVLDEPTAMLDPNGRKEVIEAVEQLRKEKNVTVILITHYMEEVIDADQVFVMDSGHIVMHGTPREIFGRADELKSYRMDVPQVTMLAEELRKRGLDIPKGILRREELVEALCRLR